MSTRFGNCISCGAEVSTCAKSAPLKKRCITCQKKHLSLLVMESRKRKIPSTVIGCGSGNMQGRGENHRSFIHGLYSSRNEFKRKKDFTCELCGYYTTLYREMCMHHKDRNRKNNSEDNLILVCKSCHQNIEHKQKRNQKGQFDGCRNKIEEKILETPGNSQDNQS